MLRSLTGGRAGWILAVLTIVSTAPAAGQKLDRAEVVAGYRALIDQYRRGEDDAAVRQLLERDRGWIDLAVRELPRAAGTTVQDLEAAALLQTEAAFASASDLDADYHRSRALDLLNRDARDARRALPRAFVRDWHVLLARDLQYELKLEALAAFVPRMSALFPRDPAVIVVQGMFYEALGWTDNLPIVLPPPLRRERAWYLEQAAASYRQAVSDAPGLAEARLRLARVLVELGRMDDAQPLLQRLREDGGAEEADRYLALLFSGAAHERAGQLDAAVERYRAAVTLEPACQTPSLALSAALRSRGDRDEASRVLLRTATLGPQCDDPWWTYKFGDPARIDELLDALRAGAAVRVRLTVLLAASAALLVGAAALHAQFRSRVAAVRVDVLATERGAPIPNLAAADFEVLDNGVPQQIDAVYAEHEPLDVLFAFDRSLSVRGETLRGLLEAAHAAIDQLTSDDRAAVLAFDHSFHLEQPMTEELTAVHRAIDGIDAGGSTSLFDALYAALTVAETGGRRTLILLFTDGIDNLSWLHEDAALRVARQSEAVVYTVAYEAPHPPTIVPYDKRVLQEIAETTGGRVLAASETGRLKASFVDVMREMRTRYLLTYTPTNADTPGFHTLSVKLKRRSGRIVARRGYEVARRQ